MRVNNATIKVYRLRKIVDEDDVFVVILDGV